MYVPSSIDESLKSPELNQIGIDAAEAILDNSLTDSLIKEIPILSILWGGGKVIMSLSDKIFTNKLLACFSSFKDVDHSIRREIIEKIDKDPKYQLKVGEKLMYLIDKSEDRTIAGLIGILTKALFEKVINYEQFIVYSRMVTQLGYYNLKVLATSNSNTMMLGAAGEYIAAGFFEIDTLTAEMIAKTPAQYATGDIRGFDLKVSNQAAVITKEATQILDILGEAIL